jgi:hypothetical protein
MKELKLLFCFLLTLIFTSCLQNETTPKISAQQSNIQMSGLKNLEIIQRNFDELNNNFTYVNKPISPYAILQLSSGNNALPVIVSIDVEGLRNSTQYLYNIPYFKDADGSLRINFKNFVNYEINEEVKGYFAYKHLGKLKNNLHILETFGNSGGEDVIKTILFVRCVISEGDPSLPDKSILIHRVSEIELGPNYAGTIKILQDENAVEIGADKFILTKQVIKFNQ